MMNTQTATAKAIDWNKVLRVTFRFALALAVLSFKVTVIVGSAILKFFAAWLASGRKDDAPEYVEPCQPNIGRNPLHEYAPRDHRSI